MENSIKCPVCHIGVRPTDYFCFNCGNNLKPKPLPVSFAHQLGVYLKSVLVPPYGIIVGMRYLREKESKSKFVGVCAIILTIVSILVFTGLTLDFINRINEQVNTQMLQFGSF